MSLIVITIFQNQKIQTCLSGGPLANQKNIWSFFRINIASSLDGDEVSLSLGRWCTEKMHQNLKCVSKSTDVRSPNTFRERSLLSGGRHLLSSLSVLLPKLERTPLVSPLLPGLLLLPPDALQRRASVSSSGSLSVEAQPGVSRHVPP